MSRAHRRALVLLNGGLGNGFILAPVLRALEQAFPGLIYDSPANEVLTADWVHRALNMQGPTGQLPTLWRRFAPSDHDRMLRYARAKNVSLVVNLRKEDPRLDAGYFSFREKARLAGIECWDLHELSAAEQSLSIGEQASTVLRRHGVPTGVCGPAWLAGYAQPRPRVAGLSVGASVGVKRWSSAHWAELALSLSQLGWAVEVACGPGRAENSLADEIRLQCPAVSPVSTSTILKARDWTASLSALVTNDTLSAHLAAALGIPSVGIYLATMAHIWRPRSVLGSFVGVQSLKGSLCPLMKVDGSCTRFYKSCPSPCGDVSTADVLLAMQVLLQAPDSGATTRDSYLVADQTLGALPGHARTAVELTALRDEIRSSVGCESDDVLALDRGARAAGVVE